MYLHIGLIRSLVRFFFVALLLHLTLPTLSFGSEPNRISDEKFNKEVKYELTVKDNLITLNAEDAFLKKILEDIGVKMNIEVYARIPAENKITIRFDNLMLEEALKKFKTNYALVTDSKDKKGNIKRIVVVPEGQQANLYLKEVKKGEQRVKRDISDEKSSKPEPFKFEFDPSKYNANNQ